MVSTTTHKTLRGPRGGMLMCKAAHQKAIDRAVFPGLQGGPHNHTTAGIAVALHEAADRGVQGLRAPDRRERAGARGGAVERGFSLITGGTDNHLILADLTPKGVSGKIAAKALDAAGIELNYNSIPFDPRKPFDPSGIRLGTRGGHQPRHDGARDEADRARGWTQVVAAPSDASLHEKIAGEVRELCAKFPAPGLLMLSRRSATTAVEDAVRDLGLRAGRHVGDSRRHRRAGRGSCRPRTPTRARPRRSRRRGRTAS